MRLANNDASGEPWQFWLDVAGGSKIDIEFGIGYLQETEALNRVLSVTPDWTADCGLTIFTG